jgi:hypothetical protein
VAGSLQTIISLFERDSVMYEVFDSFLQMDTWHTRHPSDERRFFIALRNVVSDPSFSPDEMGSYMRSKLGINPDDRENAFSVSIDQYTSNAWAIRDYISANNL